MLTAPTARHASSGGWSPHPGDLGLTARRPAACAAAIACGILGQAMSEESTSPGLVEVVTGLFEAADRGEWGVVVSSYAPDAIWETDDGFLDVEGASQLRGFFEEWFGIYECFAINVETVVDLGNGVVYSVYNQSGRP